MKKRVVSLLLALVMLFCVIPVTAITSASELNLIYVAGVIMYDGDYLASNSKTTQATKPSSSTGYAYYKDEILTFHNFKCSGSNEQLIYSDTSLNIVVEGDFNAIANTSSAYNYCIYAPERIVIRGDGWLDIRGGIGICSGYEVFVNGPKLYIDAEHYGIRADLGDIYVYDSRVYIESDYVGLYTFNSKSEIALEQSIVEISAEQYGIFAEGDLYFDAGYLEMKSTGGNAYALQVYGDIEFTSDTAMYASKNKNGDNFVEYNDDYAETYQWIKMYYAYRSKRYVTVGGVEVHTGEYLPSNSTQTQKTMPETGGYAYFDAYRLHLNNFSYTGSGITVGSTDIGIYSDRTLEILLTGINNLNIAPSSSGNELDGIRVKRSVKITGDGILNVTAGIAVKSSYGGIYIEGTTINSTATQEYFNIVTFERNIEIIDSTLTIRADQGRGIILSGQKLDCYIIGSYVTIDVCYGGISAENPYNDLLGRLFVQDSYFEVSNSYYRLISANVYFSDKLSVSASYYKNGTNASVYDPQNLNSYYWIGTTRSTIRYIDVVDLSLPETNFYPDFDLSIDSPYTSIVSVHWYELDKNGNLVDEVWSRDIFEEGKKYRVIVTVRAADGYEFDDINTSAYLGPDMVISYAVQKNQKLRVLSKDYTATGNPENLTLRIGTVTLSNGDYLANGETSVTATKPSGGYAYYKDGVLYLNEYRNLSKAVYYKESFFEVNVSGVNNIGSFVDDYDNEEKEYSIKFTGDGSLAIMGYSEGWDGSITATGGDIILDGPYVEIGDNGYCFEGAEYLYVYSGEIYAYTSQSGAFAVNDDTYIYVYGGSLELFDAGCYNDFISEDIYMAAGDVYVGEKRNFETATLWDGETALTTYESVWVTPRYIFEIGATVQQPEIGMTPNYYAESATDHCYAEIYSWFRYENGDFVEMEDGEAFECGVQYAVSVDFYIEDGYSATEDSRFFINDIETDYWAHSSGNLYYGYVIFDALEEPVPEPSYTLGDIDNDGTLTTADYIFVKRAYMGTYTLSAVQLLAADIDEDDTITTADYIFVKRAYMGTYTIES